MVHKIIMLDDYYKIGKIGKPHGINGEVVFMFSDDVFDQTEADHLMLNIDGLLVPFFFEEYRFRTEETALVKFEGVNSKEQAQTITNSEVFFPRQKAEESDHYSWDMLVGYSILAGKKNLGAIDNVDTSTENYLFEIGELLIPVADEWIEDIDHDNRIIKMNLPEGLL